MLSSREKEQEEARNRESGIALLIDPREAPLVIEILSPVDRPKKINSTELKILNSKHFAAMGT